MQERVVRGLRRLDQLNPRLGLALGAGAGLVAGYGAAAGGPWVCLGLGALGLGSAAGLVLTARPVSVRLPEVEASVEGRAPPRPEEGSPALAVPAAEEEASFEPLEMIELAGGTFWMGSPEGRGYGDERPRHRVTVSPFAMAKMPVTQRLYRGIMREDRGTPRGPNLPVNRVSWYDAIEFCNRLSDEVGLTRCYRREGDRVEWDRGADGYRLPTEAEWEYAARAGTKEERFFEGDEEQLDEYAWFGDWSGSVQPVGKKKPNSWGLHDVYGNVWEWCWDWFGPYGHGELENPDGPQTGDGRVLRGGSSGNGPEVMRSALRYWNLPMGVYWFIGFRCVRGPRRQP